MIIARYILLGSSALMTLLLLLFWTVSGRASDLLVLVALIYLMVNTFYLFFTKPSIQTSEIIQKASGFFAHASLELQYQAQEAQEREAKYEAKREAEIKNNHYKLQAAKEFLDHLRNKMAHDTKVEIQPRQITEQVRLKEPALPTPRISLSPGEAIRLPGNHEAAAKPVQPVAPTVLLSHSGTALN